MLRHIWRTCRLLAFGVLPACRLGFEGAPAVDANGGTAPPDELGLSLDAVILADGVAAPACGATVLMQDDFDAVGPAPVFSDYTDGGLTLREQGSQFEIAFNASVGDGSYAGYVSNDTYAKEGLCATVRVVAVPASNGMAYFKLRTPTEQVELAIHTGQLRVRTHLNKQVATLLAIPYSASEHAYLRIRHAGPTTFWDASGDGVSYTVLAMTDFVTGAALKYELGAGSFGATTNGGIAAFDDARVLGP